MNRSRFSLAPVALLAMAAAGVLSAAKPVACSPFPVTVQIQNESYLDGGTSYTPRIRSDGSLYVDGADGVEAIIHSCPDGTGDMTLKMGAAKKNVRTRTFTLDLTDLVYSTPNLTPSWVSQPIVSSGQLTIGKIAVSGYDATGNYSFQTGFGASGLPNLNYYLRANTAFEIDYPCNTSKVNVTHIAAVLSGTVIVTPETWIVFPDSTPSQCSGNISNPVQVISLVDSRTNWSSVSQSRMPFYLTIKRK